MFIENMCIKHTNFFSSCESCFLKPSFHLAIGCCKSAGDIAETITAETITAETLPNPFTADIAETIATRMLEPFQLIWKTHHCYGFKMAWIKLNHLNFSQTLQHFSHHGCRTKFYGFHLNCPKIILCFKPLEAFAKQHYNQ